MGIPEQARDTGGLREAIASWIGRSGYVRPQGDPPDHDRAWRRMLSEADGLLEDERFRAALSQGAAHEEQGLDVERLAKAMATVRPYGGNPDAWARHTAERIAAEYLATPEAAPEEETPCRCTADTELGAGSVCTVCGHRDHGASGCHAATPTPTTEDPHSITETPEDNR